MNDFITRTTFGFVMSQLFPGTIAVFSIVFAYQAIELTQPNAVLAAVSELLKSWNDASTAHLLFLLGVCVGFGMFIHALNWAVLGALAHQPGRVFDSRFHRRSLLPQVFGGPVRAVYEVGVLLVKPKEIREARMSENAPDIHQDFMRQFDFLQDFYLYSAQFFAHTTFALLAAFGAVVTFMARYGVTGRRAILLALLYCAAGAFFVLGRIQLASLIKAEVELAARSAKMLGTTSQAELDALVSQDTVPAAGQAVPLVDPKLNARTEKPKLG